MTPVACTVCTSADAQVLLRGEVSNADELRSELGLRPDESLQAVLLAAWQRWSIDSFAKLNGGFALTVRNANELFLYRDPSGLQGLFYAGLPGGRVAFATELAQLPSDGADRPRWARQSLHEYLRFLDISAPNTMRGDAHAVEPGQVVHCSPRAIAKWLVPPSATGEPEPPDFAEAVSRLDLELSRAVAMQLRDVARPAAFLSGGIDSSLICAMAARQRPDLTMLTVGFDGARFDEAPIAQKVAASIGAAHQVLRFGRQDYLSAFERLSGRMDQPMADPATMATVLAFDHCREHFDGVLDGTGADEAVGAMPPRHVRLAVGYASLLPAGLRRALVRAMSAVPGLAGYTPILDFEHPADTMIRWKGFTRTEIEELCGEPVSFGHTQFYRTFARFPRHAHYERYSALLNAMPIERLTQAALISGVRVRCPFSERDTDAFIRQLRTDWRYLPGQPKRILRALLARYVPREIWDVPKHGFDFPLHEFLAGDDFALVQRYVNHGRWLDTQLLRADVVRRYGRQYMAGDRRLMFRVWALVVLGAWLEKHDELT
ncbi:MAG TPA: asparagine synthase-related protein [Burkholderiaceae bacterium]|nr:asparagine synthase-related protein [Burkholderiaceae bacterium]